MCLPIESGQTPREPRHSAVVPARLRGADGWCDATILNLSNHGLMFRCAEPLERGHYLELRRGSHVIVARVVWNRSGRVGARAQGVIPVADILLDQPVKRGLLSLTQRRAAPRPRSCPVRSRERGRAMEFVAAACVGAAVALLVADVAISVLSDPLHQAGIALVSR